MNQATAVPTNRNNLLLNSALAFALAGVLATTSHELAHLTAGIMLGESGRLYPNTAEFGAQVSAGHQIITALAGPFFSLVSGLLIIWLAKTWGRGFVRLFWLWFGFLSAQIGFGYLIIAPLAQVGDTGKALALLSAPPAVFIASFIVGVAGMLLLAKLFAARAVAYSTDTASLRAIGLFSWLVGTALLLAIYAYPSSKLSSEVISTVMMGIGTIGIFTPMLTFFYKKVKVRREVLSLRNPLWGGLLVAVAGFGIVMLANGI